MHKVWIKFIHQAAAGGVLHLPPVGRGPAFSQVVIFHLAYARRIRVCLAPFYKLVVAAYHLAQEGACVMELFGAHPIILVFGLAGTSIGKSISFGSRINQPDMDPDGILSLQILHTLEP